MKNQTVCRLSLVKVALSDTSRVKNKQRLQSLAGWNPGISWPVFLFASAGGVDTQRRSAGQSYLLVLIGRDGGEHRLREGEGAGAFPSRDGSHWG